MTNLELRELRKDDHEKWLSLYEDYLLQCNAPVTPKGVAATWSWLVDVNHPLIGAAAVLDGKLAGVVHFRSMPSPLRGEQVGFLHNIFVDSAFRGKGIAEALIGFVRKHASANGWGVVRWVTEESNYRARAVYDRVAVKSDSVIYEMHCDR